MPRICSLCGDEVEQARGLGPRCYRKILRAGKKTEFPLSRVRGGFCSVPGCGEKHHAKGMCRNHRRKFGRTK